MPDRPQPLDPFNPTGEKCARCGEVAVGSARGYENQRLCHGDNQRPSCYEQYHWDRTKDALAEMAVSASRTDRVSGIFEFLGWAR